MKKFFAMVLAMCMMGTTAYAAEPPAKTVTAKPLWQEVTIDGYETVMSCYNINGYTYFRLRDVAKLLTDHGEYAHFAVEYDAEYKRINIIRNADYVGVKPEKETLTDLSDKQASASGMTFCINGTVLRNPLEGYVIDGYTYYKLRDLAGLTGIDIGWCAEERVIEIYTENDNPFAVPPGYRKPVIYLYPEETTDVSVKVDCDLTVTYPSYNDGWKVTAQLDGTLTNHADGRAYSYLFWEGEGYGEMDFFEGFVVKCEDTVSFLQEKLSAMGMIPREYNEFIVYWLPYMQDNAYNLISFQWENYDVSAKLNITPEPDNMLRVFMAFKALEEPIDIPEQKLPTLQREGFTVVEWGGTEM